MGASLPQIKVDDQAIMLMQSRWKSQLDPLLTNLMANGNLVKDITLLGGDNVINHLLSRMMQGWILVDQNGPSTIYRSKPLSTTTLTLNATFPVTVAIWCF